MICERAFYKQKKNFIKTSTKTFHIITNYTLKLFNILAQSFIEDQNYSVIKLFQLFIVKESSFSGKMPNT